ncbi:MAG: TlpA family protein disulfide reductase [Myxococcales bacterium]|nr:TlpA family protein disulfide reductase [Myxococcales bacterium]MCB9755860.1 TlpA family protein disulfide reductase [Myxococcales bacterium]
MQRALFVLALAACGAETGEAPPADAATDEASGELPASRAGGELVGVAAQPFARDLQWINGEPRTLESLRGRVVFVRFWTDTCPYCQASAPGIQQLHERYGGEGLVVLGLYHPKPRGAEVDVDAVQRRARELGMEFSIASDPRWDTLDRWWLRAGAAQRRATSVSFILDRAGVVRWIHPGPELHPGGPPDHEQCRADFADAERVIQALLAEQVG